MQEIALPSHLIFRSLHDVLALPSVPERDWRLLPGGPGLYFAVANQEEVAYIGMSQMSLRGRWIDHDKRRELRELGDVHVAYVCCDDIGVLWIAERDAIRAMAPRLNAQYLPGRSRALSLKIPGSELLLTVEGAAEYLTVSHMTVHRYIRHGRLPKRFFGRELVLFKSDLDNFERRPAGRPRKQPPA